MPPESKNTWHNPDTTKISGGKKEKSQLSEMLPRVQGLQSSLAEMKETI